MSATHNSTASDDVSHSFNPKGGDRDEYPEQIHAGAVGYGPNYRTGPTLTDKVQGLKEEIKGKLTNNPDLVQHGRDVKSGAERKKKLTGEDETNPFSNTNKSEGNSFSKDSLSKESSSNAAVQNSGSDTSSLVHPRHQSHPMQPAVRTEPPQQHNFSDSTEPHQSHHIDTNTNTDTNTNNTDTDTTHLPGLNSPFGLRDGKIQTVGGTPNHAPTTASQQPGLYDQEDQHTTNDQSQTPAELTGSDSVPDAPIRETAPTPGSSLPFQTKPPGSIKEQQDQQMTRSAHAHSSFDEVQLQPTDFQGHEKAATGTHQPFQTETIGQGTGVDQTTQTENVKRLGDGNESKGGTRFGVDFDVDDTPVGQDSEAAKAAAAPQPPVEF